MTQTVLPDPEPAAAVIRSLRISLRRWRACAAAALACLAVSLAAQFPGGAVFALCIIAHVAVAAGGALLILYRGNAEMGIAGREDVTVHTIRPQPPIS